MKVIRQIRQEFPILKKVINVIWSIVAIVGLIILGIYFIVFNFGDYEFVPYSAKVLSVYTEKVKRGGVYYQNIRLDNNYTITTNGFTTIMQGHKIRLIDYIAIGDSVVCDSTDRVLYIHREGAETYRFTQNPDDFRN